jgi:glycosyltransferase involved in cell wall biosynthesis
VIIPAFNEENAVGRVIWDIPKELVTEVIVVNNNSTDETSRAAESAGAKVLFEEINGYGRACLKGMDYLKGKMEAEDIVVFLDADYSDHPEQMTRLTGPIYAGKAKMVIGSRKLGKNEAGSMTFPQRFGNWLACSLIRMIYGVKFTDLGPFRAIEYGTLVNMQMQDQTYGWTVEMQVKAAKLGIPSVDVPVDYRKRIGFSKISGTMKGTVLAGYKIITTIFKYAFR